MMTISQMRETLAKVQYPGFEFGVGQDVLISPCHSRTKRGRIYLQIKCPGATCSVTGEPYDWSGRKWFLSPHMTPSELIQTALKAALTAAEHEVREAFTYKGKAIFGPHIDVEELVAVCDRKSKRAPFRRVQAGGGEEAS